MTQHRNFDTGNVLPAGFVDALEQFVGTQSSPFVLVKASGTSIALKTANGNDPGSGNDQVGAGIQGRFRFVTAAVSASVPGGLAAGEHDIYFGSPDNDFTAEDARTFDYSFAMRLVASGSTPSDAIYRKVGSFLWSGSAILAIHQTVGVYTANDELWARGYFDDGNSWGLAPERTWAIPHGLGVTPSWASVSSTPANSTASSHDLTISNLESRDDTYLHVRTRTLLGGNCTLPGVFVVWEAKV